MVAMFRPIEAASLRWSRETVCVTVDVSLLSSTLTPAARESSFLSLWEEAEDGKELLGGRAGRPPLDFEKELYP